MFKDYEVTKFPLEKCDRNIVNISVLSKMREEVKFFDSFF